MKIFKIVSLYCKTPQILYAIIIILNQSMVSQGLVRKVSTAKQFQRALDKALPGDIIKLRPDILFHGYQFTASRSGEAGNPIFITGFASTVGSVSINLNSKEATGLMISGDYWKIDGIELVISEPHIGVKVEGNHNFLTSLLVTGSETGIYISGSGNIVENCIFNSTQGTGMYITGKNNLISKTITEGNEWGMYFTGKSKNTIVEETIIRGATMIQGSQHLLKDCAINGELLIADCHNKISGVNAELKSRINYPEHCTSIDNLHITYVN